MWTVFKQKVAAYKWLIIGAVITLLVTLWLSEKVTRVELEGKVTTLTKKVEELDKTNRQLLLDKKDRQEVNDNICETDKKLTEDFKPIELEFDELLRQSPVIMSAPAPVPQPHSVMAPPPAPQAPAPYPQEIDLVWKAYELVTKE